MKYETFFYDFMPGDKRIGIRVIEGTAWIIYSTYGGVYADVVQAGEEWRSGVDEYEGIYETREEAFEALSKMYW